MTYITQKGDTWDKIAYDQYGSEEMMSVLINSNAKYIETAVFDFGTELQIPTIEQAEQSTNLPPWR